MALPSIADNFERAAGSRRSVSRPESDVTGLACEEKESWHSIDLKLTGRALDLRNHLCGSQGAIDTTAEVAEDDLGDEFKDQRQATVLYVFRL